MAGLDPCGASVPRVRKRSRPLVAEGSSSASENEGVSGALALDPRGGPGPGRQADREAPRAQRSPARTLDRFNTRHFLAVSLYLRLCTRWAG